MTCCETKPYCKGMCKKHYNAHYLRANRAALRAYQRAYRKRPSKTPCEKCGEYRAKKTAALCECCYVMHLRKKNPSVRAGYNAYAASYNKSRYGRVVQATPPWADKEAIRKIYENCPEGYEVDHIVPVKGKNVTGLHLPWNLQYLPRSENRRKRNTF